MSEINSIDKEFYKKSYAKADSVKNQEKPDKKQFRKVLIVALILFVTIASFASGFILSRNLTLKEIKSAVDENNCLPSVLSDSEPYISITEPSAGDKINGLVRVSGEASSSFEEILIKIVDSDDNALVEDQVKLNNQELTTKWSRELNIQSASASESARLVVSPIDEELSKSYSKEVYLVVNRLTDENKDRVILEYPLENQLITDKPIRFKGQMKDFFEATMYVRMFGENGNQVFEEFVFPTADNYSKFAPFDTNIDFYEPLSIAGNKAKIQILDIDPKTAKETVLVEFWVRVK